MTTSTRSHPLRLLAALLGLLGAAVLALGAGRRRPPGRTTATPS